MPVIFPDKLWFFNFYERNKNNIGELKDYSVGTPSNGDFYDFMVFGGKWGENDTYQSVVKNAREIVGKPQFVNGISSAFSPNAMDRKANEYNKRMYSQTGYFFYSTNPMQDLDLAISHAFIREEARCSKEEEKKIDARLLRKIEIPVVNAKLIKKYLQNKGYNDAYFGFDENIPGLNKNAYSFKIYLEETSGGYDYRNGNDNDFIKKYISPLEVWLD